RLAVVGAAINGHSAAVAPEAAAEGDEQLPFSRRVVLELDHSRITRTERLRLDGSDRVVRCDAHRRSQCRQLSGFVFRTRTARASRACATRAGSLCANAGAAACAAADDQR